ncbi:dehydrin DHN1 [Dendrobium catenatum]|uniref:Dehydrin COR410 n=1 Tax=Dendrobium catenatum TaxID=906689 RepID=A0A2I0XB15_9ASPA|nr:dehydrin DHN1 [Dendrobium catenatum]PKU85118.1 Dehydrin COR410 [Dendrobium catenatum]
MAEEFKDQANLNVEGGEGEVRNRGLFDFVHKKKEEEEEKKPQQEEEVLVSGVEKIHIEDGHKVEDKKKEGEKNHGLLEKLHRSHSSSSSSSSSDEEEEVEGEGGIKQKIKKKKQGLKEKLHGREKKEKEEEKKEPAFVPAAAEETPAVVVEKVDVFEEAAPPPEAEKKGFLDKIKEKLPGHGKKAAEESGAVPPPPLPVVEVPAEHVKEHEVVEGTEGKEKKGFLGKIIEKLPGYHKNAGEEPEKSPGSH